MRSAGPEALPIRAQSSFGAASGSLPGWNTSRNRSTGGIGFQSKASWRPFPGKKKIVASAAGQILTSSRLQGNLHENHRRSVAAVRIGAKRFRQGTELPQHRKCERATGLLRCSVTSEGGKARGRRKRRLASPIHRPIRRGRRPNNGQAEEYLPRLLKSSLSRETPSEQF
jgi:hypothetical protein